MAVVASVRARSRRPACCLWFVGLGPIRARASQKSHAICTSIDRHWNIRTHPGVDPRPVLSPHTVVVREPAQAPAAFGEAERVLIYLGGWRYFGLQWWVD